MPVDDDGGGGDGNSGGLRVALLQPPKSKKAHPTKGGKSGAATAGGDDSCHDKPHDKKDRKLKKKNDRLAAIVSASTGRPARCLCISISRCLCISISFCALAVFFVGSILAACLCLTILPLLPASQANDSPCGSSAASDSESEFLSAHETDGNRNGRHAHRQPHSNKENTPCLS